MRFDVHDLTVLFHRCIQMLTPHVYFKGIHLHPKEWFLLWLSLWAASNGSILHLRCIVGTTVLRLSCGMGNKLGSTQSNLQAAESTKNWTIYNTRDLSKATKGSVRDVCTCQLR